MVNEKGKIIVATSSPVKMNGKETGVACERRDEEENAIKEVMNEENAEVERKNGKIAMEEENNEDTASGEDENNEGKKMEEDKKNESNALEEEDNDQDATEEDDYEEDEDEEDDEEEEQQQGEEEEKGLEKEENPVEQEEEEVGANSKEKVERSGKRNKKKIVEEEGEEEEDEEEEEKVGHEGNTKEQENEKVGANSGEKVLRPRKRKRKNSMIGAENLTTKEDDKPGSSGKQKPAKKVESMGMIFMCSSKTKKDCYRYNVLGLPESKRDIVKKIYKGMRLFLFDLDLKLMYGIYKAAGPGGYNIEAKAFKSAFPSQVRFTVLEDCLPLAEEKFKTVIKENYYGKNKFNCQLTSKQVKDLCKLFTVSSRGSKSRKLSRNARAEPRIGRAEPRIARAEPRIRADRGRIPPRSRDGRGRSSALSADRRRRDTRPTTLDRERYGRRDWDEERRSPLVGFHQHHDHPIMYERGLEPQHRLPPLPLPLPTARAPAYASYGRTVEVDAYGRELVVERRDPRPLDLDTRYGDEIVSRDPYIPYREIPPHRDILYSSALLEQPEHYRPVEPRTEYRLAAPPPSEYRRHGAAPAEYDHLRPMYRY